MDGADPLRRMHEKRHAVRGLHYEGKAFLISKVGVCGEFAEQGSLHDLGPMHLSQVRELVLGKKLGQILAAEMARAKEKVAIHPVEFETDGLTVCAHRLKHL